MPLLDNEIVWKPALLNGSLPTQNGGCLNRYQTIPNNVKNSLFGSVSKKQRTEGLSSRKKAFLCIVPQANTDLLDSHLFIDQLTPADDFVVFRIGAFEDTEDQALYSGAYGVGTLYANTLVNATTIVVVPENIEGYKTLTPFSVGMTVRIANRTYNGATGNEEYKTIETVTYGSSLITITLTTPLAYAYPLIETFISSTYILPVLKSYAIKTNITSLSGTCTGLFTTYHNVTPFSSWQITMQSATNYTLTAFVDSATKTWNGSITSLLNANETIGTQVTTLFSVPASIFGGTFVAGDTIEGKTFPAAIPVWFERTIPPLSGTLNNDFCSISLQGESE